MSIRTGQEITLYDGTTATVISTRCNECASNRDHEECSTWYRVGDRRWVSEDGIVPDESHQRQGQR